jgi:hypothetical protein
VTQDPRVQLLSLLRNITRSGAARFALANPQLCLSAGLFAAGLATVPFMPPLAGALVGAGAALLGTWITEWQKRRTADEEKAQKQAEARRYLVPELHRTIERVLYIHGRAVSKFVSASVGHTADTGDAKEDFIPYAPVLYPTAPQFMSLPGDDAIALIAYYDSLHALEKSATDWWERAGQLPVNIFNMILHHADKSLELALACIDRFDVEAACPPPYEAWGTLTSRIERARASAAEARKHHIQRFEAASKVP